MSQNKKNANVGLLAPNGKKSNLSPENYKLVRSLGFKKWYGDWENDPTFPKNELDENGEPIIVVQQNKNRYSKGGLLAPNGKPSKLTPEQYKLVRTPEFKAWFGDWENDRENSGKISGITREPSIWYHSTKSNFLNKKGENIFKNPPFYFALTKDVAEDIVKIQHQNTNGKVVTKPFFIKYKNPFDITKFDILSDKKLTSLIKKLTPYESEKEIKSFMLRLGLPNSSKNTWNLTETKEIQDWIKSKKYDSFFIYEDGHKNLAVFEPNQIKLADGANTTFDGNNPDIRYAKGGKLKFDVQKEEQILGLLSYAETQKYLSKKYKSFKKENAQLEDLPNIYIRAGLPKIKKNGTFDVSKNGITGEKEEGVSVFNAKYSPKSNFIFVDLEGGWGSYDINLSYRESQFYEDKGYDNYKRKMYLVDGEQVDYGSDGEPLLDNKTIKVIGVLNPNKIVPSKSFLKEYLGGINRFFGGKEFKKYPNYEEGGNIGQEITCVNCGWHWNTNQSDEFDKYVCHNCGFDNSTFYDSELIGLYKEGGVFDEYNNSRIKKVYVSIKIKNELKRDKTFKYQIESSDNQVFQELKNHKLLGVEGVSSSRYNIADWLTSRECLVVMNFDDFIKQNDAEQIHYDDASYLTQNGLDIMFRIYNRKEKDDSAYYSVLQNLFPKIALQFQLESQLYSDERYTQYGLLEHIFNVYNSGKFIRYFAEKPRVSSVKDFADIAIEYIQSGQSQIDYYSQRQPQVIDYENIIKVIDRGIVNAIIVYRDESEWILKDKTLNIPYGSQLMFVLSSYENMKDVYESMIAEYDLKKSYKINYVNYKDVSKFQQTKYKTQDVQFKENLEIKKKLVNSKIKNILNDILNTIIEKIEDKFINEIIEYNPPPYSDYDDLSIKYADSPLNIPQMNQLWLNTISKLIEFYESEIDNVVNTKHYWTFVQIFYKYEEYVRNLRDESYQNEDIVIAYDNYQNRVYLSSFYENFYRTIKSFDYREFIKDIKVKIGSDLYNVYSREEVNFKKGGMLKTPHTIEQIAKKHNVSLNVVEDALKDGIKTEKEHTNDISIAKVIALHHLWESPKYYEKLKIMENKINIDNHYEDIKHIYNIGGVIDPILSFVTPSGEPSKLNYIQQVLVRTQAFKNWFGDWEAAANEFLSGGRQYYDSIYKNVSKVIDKITFEPKVIYHGTRTDAEFYIFDVSKRDGLGRPYGYFAHNLEYSQNFTTSSQRNVANSQPFMYKCFANVKKPFYAIGHEYYDIQQGSEYWLNQISISIARDKYGSNSDVDRIKDVKKVVKSQIGKYIDDTYDIRDMSFWLLMAKDANKNFKFFLNNYNYDGVFYAEEYGMPYDVNNPAEFTEAVTIFEPNQVKLADGRNLNFDPMNEDIRFKEGGKISNTNELIINNDYNMGKIENMRNLLTNNKYAEGGEVVANNLSNGNDGKKGGYFEGRSHADGGIKAYNKDTGQMIEVEGQEVIITKGAVNDTQKREFEGEMLTNREILSKINQGGGGVSFAKGGQMAGDSCGCSGKKYKYGGEMLDDYSIVEIMNKPFQIINDNFVDARAFADMLVQKLK